MTQLIVLSATLDKKLTEKFWYSWAKLAKQPLQMDFVEGIMGVVPAFLTGLDRLKMQYPIENPIVACFHDDLKLYEFGWDEKVIDAFESAPLIGLAGFGGATGLGTDNIYASPYEPMQLARLGFMSNMRDAESHGRRELESRRVACFDGFSQIGRLDNLYKWFYEISILGIKHHFYDSMLGALSHRDGYTNWYLPIACNHAGGVTAVGNVDYQAWAKTQKEKGDQGFWEESHKIGYEYLKGILPIRIAG